MLVGLVKLELHFPFCHSLKEKRTNLSKIKGRIFSKYSIPVSEVGYQDKWQRTQLGFAVVGNDHGKIESLIDKIELFIEGLGLGEVLDFQKDITTYG